MATLNIIVDDSIVPRLIAAYRVSTNPQLKAAIIADIKERVKSYERQLAQEVEQAKVQAAEEAKRAAIAAAEATANTEIVIS